MNIPGVPLKLPDGAAPYLALGAAIIVIYFVAKREVLTGAREVLTAVDPTSDHNIFYRGANAVGGVLTGSSAEGQEFSLGSWLRDKYEEVTGTGVYTPTASPTEAPHNVESLISGGGIQ